MIEAKAIEYLAGKLSVPVYGEYPEEPDASFVIVWKTSGGGTRFLREASLAIQSIAPSLYAAAALNEAVKDAMFDFPTVKNVFRSEPDGDYEFTDPGRRGYRYQAVFDITYMEE